MATIDFYKQTAEDRFEKRKPVRVQQLEDVKKKGIFVVDDKDRIRYRRSLLNPKDGLALERILGNNDLVGVNFLEIGLKASRSVCRIQVRDLRGRIKGYGTGFMISPNLMITNNHVLESSEDAVRSLLDFNFEDDQTFVPKETKTFVLDPNRFFYTSEPLDFSLVYVQPKSTDGTPLENFGQLQLREESGKILLNEYVTIIQHPDGGTKQVALRENRLVDVFDDFVHYETDTLPGSSGSPVFNDQWEVVALHHSGVRKRDANGNVLSVDGVIWKPEMGEDKIAWTANEGIRVSSILRCLRENKDWSADQKMLINSIKAVGGLPRAPEIRDITVERHDLEWYSGSIGFDPELLGPAFRVDLPGIAEPRKSDIVPLKDGNGHELKYTHFSVVMSKSRRLAFFTAVNIKGSQLKKISRSGDLWYFDPRIEEKYQSGPELYSDNDLDRGHLVRRLDPVWGDEAEEANEDTFHFTNGSPQHKLLNQRSWQNLEDYILKNAGRHDLDVNVFTGPVFRADDMIYRSEFQIPAEFWKVVVMVKDNGKLSATAYLQTQKNLIADLEFAYGEYKTYQVPIIRIEAITELDFGNLRNYDPLAGIEGTIGRVINDFQDIRL